MKVIKSFVTVLSIFSLVSCSKNLQDGPIPSPFQSNILVRNISCYSQGPFNIDDGTVTLSFYYECSSPNTRETFKIKEYGGTSYFYSKNIKTHSFSYAGRKAECSFQLPLDEVLLDKGIEIYLFVYDTKTSEEISSRSFLLFPKQSKHINAREQKEYSIKNTILCSNQDSAYGIEYYSFYDTTSTFQNEDYFILPLNGIYFEYIHQGHNFNYDEAYLTFNDTYNLFPYVKENGKVKIPISLVFDEGASRTITFAYKNTMYVNTSSLLMSLTSRYGYVQTNYFYMPRGENKRLNETRFTLEIIGAGLNKTDISIPLDYYSLNNRFGNCDDSEYCIKGEIVE